MNFLQLCDKTRRQCGIAGSNVAGTTTPATTQNQTAEMLRIVEWVRDAYREICASRNNWKFLSSDFSVNTVANQESYLPTACTDENLAALIGSTTVGNFARWDLETFRIYLQSDGVATRQFLWWIGYDWFRNLYDLRPMSPMRPVRFTIRPNDLAIKLGPTPDTIYIVEGKYWRQAPDLELDTDVPLFPPRFHDAIVYLACRYYAGYQEDGGAYSDFNTKYEQFYGGLLADQLPMLESPQPLVQ